MNQSISAVRRTLTAISESGGNRSHPDHDKTFLAVPDAADRLHPVEILLVLDARARIQYCSEGLPFGHSEKEIIERPINSLIPDLPLRELTPGYNIAYVRCSFANNAWQRHLIAADDRQLPVDLHLRTLPVAGGYCLLGLMRLLATETNESRLQISLTTTQAWFPAMAAPLVACA